MAQILVIGSILALYACSEVFGWKSVMRAILCAFVHLVVLALLGIAIIVYA